MRPTRTPLSTVVGLSIMAIALSGCLAGNATADRTAGNPTPVGPSVSDVDYDTHWLIIGGGSSPTSNQFSLESNFLYYQRLLDQTDLPADLRHFLFADGGTDRRDLQYRVPEDEMTEDEQMRLTLAGIMGNTHEILNRYRPNRIPDLDGPATRDEVHAWFDQKADEVQSGDRVFIYFTGHGRSGTDEDKHNTTMQLWGGHSAYRMYELAEQLDKLPDDIEVVMIMVQCHSGGFAHTIFEGGKPENGLSSQTRIGFYAAIPERLAAGCSPSVDEANFQEYSSYFWAALFGETRMGEAVETPDFNGDGQVSFAEAHAHVLLTSDTIDVPVTTSDALLREYSTFDDDELLTETTSYDVILNHAAPHQAAILAGLSEQLGLSSGDRIAESRDAAEAIEQQRQELAEQRSELQNGYNRSRQQIARSLIAYWPEVRNCWHSSLPELLASCGQEMMDRIESHNAYDRFTEARDEMNQISGQRQDLEHEWVKHQRFIYTAHSVLLAANLASVADEDVVEHYHRLVDAEAGVLAF